MMSNIVLEEASQNPHLNTMEMIRKLSRGIEEMKKIHEEECEELQALRKENALTKEQGKGPMSSTPTLSVPPVQNQMVPKRMVQGDSEGATRDHNPTTTVVVDTKVVHSFIVGILDVPPPGHWEMLLFDKYDG